MKYSTGRMIGGAALGILAGLFAPMALLFSVALMVVPIAVTVLYAFAGWAGAGAALASALASALGMGLLLAPGAAQVWVLPVLFAQVLPSLLIILLVRRRVGFARGLASSVAAQIIGVALALLALWLFLRTDLVGALVDSMRVSFESMPAALVDQLLMLYQNMGVLGSYGINMASFPLTVAQRTEIIDGMLSTIDMLLRYSLPSAMLNASVVSAILAYCLPLKIMQRRGAEPPVTLPPLHEWRLNKNLILGLPGSALLCFVLNAMGINGADAAYVVMINLLYLALVVQALGAICRRLRAMGFSRGKRIAVAVIASVIPMFRSLLYFIGLYSALLGSQGLISTFYRKRMQNRDKGD